MLLLARFFTFAFCLLHLPDCYELACLWEIHFIHLRKKTSRLQAEDEFRIAL
jgi:hypothetical protein